MSKIFSVHTPADFKNYLLNSNFDLFQRGTSAATTTGGNYQADRWRGVANSTAHTFSQQSAGVPQSTSCARFTLGANNGFISLSQALESKVCDWLKGKTVTASVYVRKSAAFVDDMSITIQINSTADTQSGGSWSTVSSTTLTNANINSSTFTRLSITAAIPSGSTANGIRVLIQQASTTSPSGSFIEYTAAMLNEGSWAAPYVPAGKSFQEELELCQRYYEKSYDLATTPGTSNAAIGAVAATCGSGTQAMLLSATYRSSKRTNPTATVYSRVNGTAGNVSRAATDETVQVFGGVNAGVNGFSIETNGVGTANAEYSCHWTADAELN